MNFLSLLLVVNILVIGSSLASRFSRDEVNERIVGGFETWIEKLPWMSSLRFSNSHLCAGSIISERWILTAATCDA